MDEHQKIKQEIVDQTSILYDVDCDMELDVPEYVNILPQVPEKELGNISPKTTKTKIEKRNTPSKAKKSIQDISNIKQESNLKLQTGKYIPKPKTCNICGQQLSCTKSLKLHMRIHNDERPFKCEICDKSFRQKGGLTSHMVTHSKAKPFPCLICDGSFTTSSSLKRHQKKIHESGKKFECKYCPETFYNMVSFKVHKKEKHLSVWEPRECPECGKMLENLRMSKKHFRIVHGKKPRRKPTNNKLCVLCGKEFDTIKLYIAHKYQHLQYTKEELRTYGIDQIYPCKFCNCHFSSLGIIVAHTATHMEKTHKCEECNEKFSYFLYKRHKKHIHDEVTCQTCKKVFIGLLAMRAHKLRDHYSQKQCHICKKVLSSKHRLEAHIKGVHKEETEITKRTHQCVYCHELFFRKGILNRHIIRLHSNMLKRSCDICNIKFEYYYELTRHMQKEHSKLFKRKKMFPCHICNKSYANNDTYRRHISRHNRKKVKCVICCKELLNKNNFSQQMLQKICIHKTICIKVTCKECSKEYPNNSDFKRHLLIHSIKYKTCRFCNTDFETLENIKNHFSEDHPNENIYHCNYCNVGFPSFKAMMKHRKSQGHKKKFLSFIRFNGQTFIKPELMRSQDNTDDSINKMIKQEIHVVKTEPTEEDFSPCDNITNFDLKVVKSEPFVS